MVILPSLVQPDVSQEGQRKFCLPYFLHFTASTRNLCENKPCLLSWKDNISVSKLRLSLASKFSNYDLDSVGRIHGL